MSTRVQFVEFLCDEALKTKEREATRAVREVSPECGPVRLYKTGDGRVGFQLQLSAVAGQREVLDKVYRAIMKVLGEKRGRPPGVKTVQTKLRLPESVYRSLKTAARDSRQSLSHVVSQLAVASLTTSLAGAAGHGRKRRAG